MIERIFHLYKKMKTVGITRFYYAAKARIRDAQYKLKCVKKQHQIVKKGELNVIFSYLMRSDLDSLSLFALADAYAQNQFAPLGARVACYVQMPWYHDVRLEQSRKSEEYSFDIKVPWELARFHYAPVLAHAYRKTKTTKYLQSLKKQINSFLDAAPFLEGIHWRNPMEVAIRATNWIVSYQLVHDEFIKDTSFHEHFIQSLWHHMLFIEHNWELYDGRTNNHYLSNLIGYAYLSSFFNDAKRWNYCWKELLNEFAWQILEDGSSYEGSTAYHGFVTELFLHGFLIAHKQGEVISAVTREKIKKMLEFADATQGLRIGDDDSGFLLHRDLYDLRALAASFFPKNRDNTHVHFFRNFGLSVVKDTPWHISLRHHAYHLRQPSAHFHEDVGSITVAYHGIPIIIDPGSYLYTGSQKWRDYFRSISQHTTFCPIGWNQKKNDLFALEIPQAEAHGTHFKKSITTMHTLFGYPVSRTISWDQESLFICDDVSESVGGMEWHVMFSPHIILEKLNDHVWHISDYSGHLLTMQSDDFIFEKRSAWVSPSYGVKVPTWALYAKRESAKNVRIILKKGKK